MAGRRFPTMTMFLTGGGTIINCRNDYKRYQSTPGDPEGYPTGSELEQLALANGFFQATFYEIGFGFMGCLVCRK